MSDLKNKLRDLTQERVETERLLLLPVSMDYVNNVFKELTAEITKYMSFYPPKTIEDEVAFINLSLEALRKRTDFTTFILDKNTGEFLGGAGIHHIDTSTPEFGIWTKKSAHGKKIGREAVAGLKDWAEENLQVNYYIYPFDQDNIPSRKIAESLGGKFISKGAKEFPSGKKLNQVVYHIPKS